MYASHVPVISWAMRTYPKIFMRGCMFAILSARVPFNRVPDQMLDLKAKGDKSPCLWGWKFDAFAYLSEHYARLSMNVCATDDAGEAIGHLCTVPGLGIVKAAFVAQMLGHDVACLDVRNIEREGLPPRAWRSDGGARKTTKAFERKIARYVEQTSGRAQELWDTWCNEVGHDYGFTGEQISRMHVDAIVPRKLQDLYANQNEIPF
jgi:hypothetical protein